VQTVGLERGVQLRSDDAGFDDRGHGVGVDVENPVQVPLQVERDPVGKALAVRAGSTASGHDRRRHGRLVVRSQQIGDSRSVGR